MNDKATHKDACLNGTDLGVINVVEERAVVDTVKTVTGTVNVSLRTHQETVDVPVDTTGIDYKESRVAKNIIVSEVPEIRREGDVTIIPVTREEAVVTTRIVLVEEIHITRRVTNERQTIPVTLRKDKVTVNRE